MKPSWVVNGGGRPIANGQLSRSTALSRLANVNQRLLLALRTLADTLQRGAVVYQRPGFFGKQHAPILVLFHSEDQARTAPSDGSMELIPVSPGGHRCLAIRAVALHSVPRRPGTPQNRSLHNQVRIAVIDLQRDIACPLWRTAFAALFPCSREIRVRWRADSGRGQKQRRENSQEKSPFHICGSLP
jgi:hypothetical protein